MAIVREMSPDAVNFYLYGDNTQHINAYLQSQMAHFGDPSNNLNNQVFQALQSSHDYFSDQTNLYNLKNELFHNNILEQDNYFMELNTFQELRNANITMQRYIMAYPVLKQAYIDDNIYAYQDTYVAIDPTGVKYDDYDYRRVTNGIGMPDNEGNLEFVEYFETLETGDRELDFMEQVAVINTWRTVDQFLGTTKYDFTRPSEDPDDLTKTNL